MTIHITFFSLVLLSILTIHNIPLGSVSRRISVAYICNIRKARKIPEASTIMPIVDVKPSNNLNLTRDLTATFSRGQSFVTSTIRNLSLPFKIKCYFVLWVKDRHAFKWTLHIAQIPTKLTQRTRNTRR